MGYPWQEETIARRLKELWIAGKSANEIRALMPAVNGSRPTRNAVIGAVHRAGLSGLPAADRPNRAKPSPPPDRALPRAPKVDAHPWQPTRKPVPPKPPAPVVRPELADVKGAVPLLEIAEGQCKFPVAGEGAELMYCGRPRLEQGDGARNYCEDHLYDAPGKPGMYRPASSMNRDQARHLVNVDSRDYQSVKRSA